MDNALGKGELQEAYLRPFEIVAIACGVLTIIGTFAVSHVMVKGLLIGGSLAVLMGSLLYFGLGASVDEDADELAEAPSPDLRRY